MRLYDRVMREGIEIMHEAVNLKSDDGESIPDMFTRLVPAAVSVDLNNVVVHLATMDAASREGVQLKTLPSVVPPFPVMFAEWDVATASVWR